jgi:2-polyprenyl-6-methoxyphenol hydroxylase-like FAD-dependent oxidoreductase
VKSDHRGARIARQAADGVTVTVAADGTHSTVCECAGIGVSGDTHGQPFVLAEVWMREPLRADEVMLFFSPKGLVVVVSLPGGRHRVVSTVDDAPERPGFADVQRLLDTRGRLIGAAPVDDIVLLSDQRCESPRGAIQQEGGVNPDRTQVGSSVRRGVSE